MLKNSEQAYITCFLTNRENQKYYSKHESTMLSQWTLFRSENVSS